MNGILVEDGPDAGAIWHFGEPNHEQRALALGQAWADLSHRSVISVTGEDRLGWLHSLTTQYLERFPAGEWRGALILDPHGHIEQQLFMVDDGTSTWIHLDREKRDELLDYLEKMRFMMRVEVRDESADYVVLRAPGAPDALGGPFALVSREELPDVAEAFNQNYLQVGMWALEAERIAAGRARILFETDHKTIPNELGFLNNAVHMNKGCYRGQETVAKVFNLGKPPRRLTLLHLDGSMVTLPSHGSKVLLGDKEVGYIGSVARHYELGPIALAVIRRTVPADVTLVSEDVSATQEIIVAAD